MAREVNKIIPSLKNNGTAADDKIKALPIKYIAAPLSPLLSDIINKMLVSCDFPDELKLTKVIPATREVEQLIFIITDLFISANILKNL